MHVVHAGRDVGCCCLQDILVSLDVLGVISTLMANRTLYEAQGHAAGVVRNMAMGHCIDVSSTECA